MSKFWEVLGEKLAERWLSVSIPALLFLFGGFLCWIDYSGLSWFHELEKKSTVEQVLTTVGLLILLSASGVSVTALSRPVQRLLEGYWPKPFWGLRKVIVRHIATRAAVDAAKWQNLYAEISNGTATGEEIELFNKIDSRRRQVPVNSKSIMPTQVGNVLKVANQRPLNKYGLSPEVLWPHLRQLLSDQVRKEFEETQIGLTTAISYMIWGSFFISFGVLAWWAVPTGIVIAILNFHLTRQRAIGLAALSEVIWDLYRTELYKKLRWPLPDTPQAERQEGLKLTSYIVRGSDSTEPRFTAGS